MRTSLPALLFCLWVGLTGAAQSQTTYDALTDRAIRPKPPLPQLGLADSTLRDPTFGSLILRVMDAETVSTKRNAGFFTAEEKSFLERMREQRWRNRLAGTSPEGKTSVGLVPLTEMSAPDGYKGEDGRRKSKTKA